MASEPSYYTSKNPLIDTIESIIGKRPLVETVGAYDFDDLTEDEKEEVQNFCSFYARPGWSTGLGIIEAAEIIVKLAVENANIAPKTENL